MPEPIPKSAHGKVLVAVRDFLAALQLPTITLPLLAIQKLPYNLRDLKPGVFISPTPERFAQSVNRTIDVGLGTQVTYVQKSDGIIDGLPAIDDFLLIREALVLALHPDIGPILPGLENLAFNQEIEPGPLFDPASFEDGFDAQALIVRTWVRRRRGTSQIGV